MQTSSGPCSRPWPAPGTHCRQGLAPPWTSTVSKAWCPFLASLTGQPSPWCARSPAGFGASKAKVRTNGSIYKQGEGAELEYASLMPKARHCTRAYLQRLSQLLRQGSSPGLSEGLGSTWSTPGRTGRTAVHRQHGHGSAQGTLPGQCLVQQSLPRVPCPFPRARALSEVKFQSILETAAFLSSH